jgi:hypothetical protein
LFLTTQGQQRKNVKKPKRPPTYLKRKKERTKAAKKK